MELIQQIEGYLYYIGEPVEKRELASIFKVENSTLIEALENLRNTLAGRGVVLIETPTTVALGTHPDLSPLIEKIQKEALDKDLTKAALETLSVILYNDMSSRSEVDYIRGVNSQFSIRALLMRGLIERLPHPKDSRKFVYTPTVELLKYLGVEQLSDLPNYSEIKESILIKIKQQESKE